MTSHSQHLAQPGPIPLDSDPKMFSHQSAAAELTKEQVYIEAGLNVSGNAGVNLALVAPPVLALVRLWFGEKGGKEHQPETRNSGLCSEAEL